MDILESCVNKIQREENEEIGTISDSTSSSNSTTNINTTAEGNTPYDNIFRRSQYCSHNNINTETVLLLEQASKYVSYSKKNRNKKRQHALWKKEFLKLQNILQDADFLDSLRKRTYNVEYQNYKKPLCIYKDSGKWDKEMTLTLLKQKYHVLKEEHNDLLKNIDDKINLELIKAGIFYNKKDVKNIFEFVRGQETKLNTQKKVVKVQNDLIESIMMNNTRNKRKLRLSQMKIQKLIKFCASYFQENTKAKRDLKNITNLFVEYKMVLENLVYCCEQIGGDKIILMDGIKTAKSQADLSAATCLLKLKELDELQKNMILCEQKIEKLESNLKDQFKKLDAESQQKMEAQQQLRYVEDELMKNKNLLTDVFGCFQEILYELDNYFVNNEKQNVKKYTFAEKRNKYNAMLKRIPESVAAINLVEDMKKSRTQKTLEEIKKSQQLHLSKEEEKKREEKEREEKEREDKEREEKERVEKEREEKEREEKERIEKEREEKEREEKERVEKEREEKEREEKERKEKEREEKEREEKQEKEEEERAVASKVDLLTKTLDKIDNDKLNYEQCVDFIYKMNIPLTQENINELKNKKELTKNELSDYAISIMQNEDEILDNMITFFQIWDVKKSGFMKKDLFVFILEQFGDHFTVEESSFLQKELNATKGPTLCYVDILKKWIHGEENQ